VVEEMTDDKTLDKHVRKQLQIEHAPHLSRRAWQRRPTRSPMSRRDERSSSNWDLTRRIEYLSGRRRWSPAVEARTRRSRGSTTRCSPKEGRSPCRLRDDGLVRAPDWISRDGHDDTRRRLRLTDAGCGPASMGTATPLANSNSCPCRRCASERTPVAACRDASRSAS
jgi:hypothetical protein